MGMKNEAMMADMASLVMMKEKLGLLAGFGEIIRNAFHRVGRPAAFLGAHVGGGVHGRTMRFLERRAGQQLAGEGTGEGVACTNGIGNLDVRGQQCGNLAILGGDGAERGAAGQNDVLKVEAVDEPLACLFVVALRNGEHVAHYDQLFVVDLEDVRIAEQFFDEFVGIEVRTQVDVEELQSAFLGVLEQFEDRKSVV